MQTFTQNGAMYAKVDDFLIIKKSIELGDGVIHPGEYVQRLGHIPRTSFQMQVGWYLRYVGYVDDTLLFRVNAKVFDNIYYAFAYVSKNILLVIGDGFARDIRVDKLKTYKSVPYNKVSVQLNLFEEVL